MVERDGLGSNEQIVAADLPTSLFETSLEFPIGRVGGCLHPAYG